MTFSFSLSYGRICSDSHESDDEDGFPAGDGMSFDDEMELERKSRLPQPVPCSASA